MNDLIGKQFKRNVYGLSTWTDTVQAVWFVRELQNEEKQFTPKFYIKGTIHNYPVSEVVFLTDEPK